MLICNSYLFGGKATVTLSPYVRQGWLRPRNGDLRGVAPHSHDLVGEEIDGAVLAEGGDAGGGAGMGVGVVGAGVDGEEFPAGAAVALDAEAVVVALLPADLDHVAGDEAELDFGLAGLRVEVALAVADKMLSARFNPSPCMDLPVPRSLILLRQPIGRP